VLEDPEPVLPLLKLPQLLRRQAGDEVRPGFARVVDGRNQAIAGAGQGAGAVYDFLQDRVKVQARVDAQDRAAQPRDALLQRLDSQRVRVLSHRPVLPGSSPGVASSGTTSDRQNIANAPELSSKRHKLSTGIQGHLP